MKILNILQSEECRPLFEEVQSFVKRSLSEYNDILEHGGSRFSGKDIFDFVWGIVVHGKSVVPCQFPRSMR